MIHLGLRLFELGQLAEEPRELRAIALPVDRRSSQRHGRDGVPCDPRRARDGVHRDHARPRGDAPHLAGSAEGSPPMRPRSARRCSHTPRPPRSRRILGESPRGAAPPDDRRTRTLLASARRDPARAARGGVGRVRRRTSGVASAVFSPSGRRSPRSRCRGVRTTSTSTCARRPCARPPSAHATSRARRAQPT